MTLVDQPSDIGHSLRTHLYQTLPPIYSQLQSPCSILFIIVSSISPACLCVCVCVFLCHTALFPLRKSLISLLPFLQDAGRFQGRLHLRRCAVGHHLAAVGRLPQVWTQGKFQGLSLLLCLHLHSLFHHSGKTVIVAKGW
jgi:hypothetical protein